MSLEKLSAWIGDLIVDHWMKAVGGVALLMLGRLWGRRKASRDWEARRFMHRLNVSLSTLREGAERPLLAIRTLLEKDLAEVLLNSVAVARVLAAAARTTEADPILPLAQEDRWFVLNSVLNEVSEKFAAGVVARDMGLPVAVQTYVLCLTNEVAGSVRTRKVRAMVVRKDLLVSGAFEGDVALKSQNHQTRLATLAAMRRTLASEPDHFLEIEICTALAGAARVGGVVAAPQ